eukprot:TRINITY_DN73716_c0_g1_i1.p1 TRINITY_DN73716_c0_g1~~TRINITY_DN73716_c0_g1_i1.p1  ORF type:complete len:462 (+),score=26.57 TRINITY_DN73716_c0_g1_i1:83-1468(+)
MWIRARKQCRRLCSCYYCGNICPDLPCCTHPTVVAMLACGLSAILLMATVFLKVWRVDARGTAELATTWNFEGFQRRTYGILQVKGSSTQSWTSLTKYACDFQWTGMVLTGSSFMPSWVVNSVAPRCQQASSCQTSYYEHLQMRCAAYTKMQRISSLTLVLTFACVFVVAIASLVAALCGNSNRIGGLVFVLYLLSGACAFIVNISWAVVTDLAIKKIMETAWFPYPSLGGGWYFHLFASMMLITAAFAYGVNVMPEVLAYDAVEEKIEKHKKKLQKRQNIIDKHKEKQNLANMNFPPPPGFSVPMQNEMYPSSYGPPSAVAPTPYPGGDFGMGVSGSGGTPQQQRVDFGLSSGNSGNPALVADGNFGIGAPQSARLSIGGANFGLGPPQATNPPSGAFGLGKPPSASGYQGGPPGPTPNNALVMPPPPGSQTNQDFGLASRYSERGPQSGTYGAPSGGHF